MRGAGQARVVGNPFSQSRKIRKRIWFPLRTRLPLCHLQLLRLEMRVEVCLIPLFAGIALPSFRLADFSIGEGFNWGEALRDRTRRQPSVTSGNSPFQPRQRAASVATVEPPKEIPKPQSPAAPKSSKPDQLGERMLRGDFTMD